MMKKGIYSINNKELAQKISMTVLFFVVLTIPAVAQEISLNSKDNRNKQSVSVKLYDKNEGGYLLDLNLTFHLNQHNILFMVVGEDNGMNGNSMVWMFDKAVELNDFLKTNKNVSATKSFKKQTISLESFYEQSENVEKYAFFDNNYECVRSSPKPVFFRVEDLLKPIVLKLKFYISTEKNDRTQVLTSEAGIIKISINVSNK